MSTSTTKLNTLDLNAAAIETKQSKYIRRKISIAAANRWQLKAEENIVMPLSVLYFLRGSYLKSN